LSGEGDRSSTQWSPGNAVCRGLSLLGAWLGAERPSRSGSTLDVGADLGAGETSSSLADAKGHYDILNGLVIVIGHNDFERSRQLAAGSAGLTVSPVIRSEFDSGGLRLVGAKAKRPAAIGPITATTGECDTSREGKRKHPVTRAGTGKLEVVMISLGSKIPQLGPLSSL
jgi:hypothetical protein